MAFTTGSTAFYLMAEGNYQSGVGGIWQYRSSDAAGDISGTTGYFKGVGAGGNGAGTLGVRVGDVILNVESTGGVTPGRVSWHSVVTSTANGTTSPLGSTVGYDVSVSAAATT